MFIFLVSSQTQLKSSGTLYVSAFPFFSLLTACPNYFRGFSPASSQNNLANIFKTEHHFELNNNNSKKQVSRDVIHVSTLQS